MAIETGKYVKRFAFWNPATWAIPKLYWDAFSQEQRIHAICRQLEKVIRYADYVGVNVDDIAQRLQDIEDGKLDDIIVAAVEAWFEEHASDITQRITALESELGDGFTEENTVTDTVANLNTAIDGISDVLPLSEFSAENTVKDELDAQAETVSKVERDNLIKANILNANADFRFDYQDEPEATTCAGNVVYEVDGLRYFAAGLITGTSTVDADAKINIYRLADGQLIKTLAIGGHANCLTYHDRKLYVSGGATTQNVYIINVNDPDNIYLENVANFSALALRIGIGTSGWLSATKLDDGYYMAHQADGRIWWTDDNFENEKLITTLVSRDVNESVEQNIVYIPFIDLFAYVFADRIEWYEKTGELFKVTHFEPLYQFCVLDEIEGIALFENGDFYFANNYITCNVPTFKGWKICTLFKTNMNTCDAPNNKPGYWSGNIPDIYVGTQYDIIPQIDTGYIGYTRAIRLYSPGDIMGVYMAYGLSAMAIRLDSDIETPIVLMGVKANINFNSHLFPGVFLSRCEFFGYGYQACYNDEDLTPIFTDNGYPTLIYSRGSTIACSGVAAKVGNKYLFSAGFGIVTTTQGTVDAHACYLSNYTAFNTATNVS